MRHIHDIEGQVQGGGGADLYSSMVTNPEYNGYRVSLLFVSTSPLGEKEVIRIDGNAKYVRQFFEQGMKILDTYDELMPKTWEARQKKESVETTYLLDLGEPEAVTDKCPRCGSTDKPTRLEVSLEYMERGSDCDSDWHDS